LIAKLEASASPTINSVDRSNMPKPPGEPTTARGLDAARKRALRAETIGIIVIAVVIFLFTVLRYGAHINWSTR
jgi:hypothetical protein